MPYSAMPGDKALPRSTTRRRRGTMVGASPLIAEREQDALLRSMQSGEANGDRWSGLDAKRSSAAEDLVDVPASTRQSSQNLERDRGFGGPVSPRGYVRLEGGEGLTSGRRAEAVA